MSGSTPQASQNFNRQLAETTAAIDQKVDALASALGGLTIGDDLKQHINLQLAEIRVQMQQEINKTVTARKEFKTKDIDPYNGDRNAYEVSSQQLNYAWKTRESKMRRKYDMLVAISERKLGNGLNRSFAKGTKSIAMTGVKEQLVFWEITKK